MTVRITESPPPPAPSLTLTFGDVCDEYLKRHVRIPGRRPQGLKAMEILIAVLRRAGIPASQAAVVTLETNAEGARTRRLEPAAPQPDGSVRDSEEARLLRHAGPHLRAVIVAALTTGCRLGELLSLQWSQVRRDDKGEARWLVLPGAKTKTVAPRVIPVGPRLRAELEMRRHAPDGKEHPATAYIFGDETGGEVKNIRRAWETAVLKAHGHTPDWIAKGKLSRASRAILRGIDLHFHDLRRQFACTLLESGADLHDVRDFLES